MNFGNKLKTLRDSKNLSLQQLADKIESTKSLIWKYENNKSIPSTEIIKRIAIYFNVSTDYLIFDEFDELENLKVFDKKLLTKLKEFLNLGSDYKKHLENTIDIILKTKNIEKK